MKYSVKFRGVEKFKRNIDKYSKKVQDKAKVQVIKSSINIHSNAKKDTPVKTGRLRGSIDHTLSFDKLEATVGTNVHYAPYVEAKKPYLYPATEKERASFVANMKRILKQ